MRPVLPLAAIGRKLEAAGVVRSRYAFDLVRWSVTETAQAGAYRFDHPAPVTEVYARIARGDVYTKAADVRRAQTSSILRRAWNRPAWARDQDFLDAAVSQTALVADLDPAATSLEGYLFPDTYRFPPTMTAAQIAAAMVQALPRRRPRNWD